MIARKRVPGPATARQEDYLEAIRALAAEGAQTSAQAVADRLGVARQVATRRLLELERKGLIRDKPKLVRSGHWVVT